MWHLLISWSCLTLSFYSYYSNTYMMLISFYCWFTSSLLSLTQSLTHLWFSQRSVSRRPHQMQTCSLHLVARPISHFASSCFSPSALSAIQTTSCSNLGTRESMYGAARSVRLWSFESAALHACGITSTALHSWCQLYEVVAWNLQRGGRGQWPFC